VSQENHPNNSRAQKADIAWKVLMADNAQRWAPYLGTLDIHLENGEIENGELDVNSLTVSLKSPEEFLRLPETIDYVFSGYGEKNTFETHAVPLIEIVLKQNCNLVYLTDNQYYADLFYIRKRFQNEIKSGQITLYNPFALEYINKNLKIEIPIIEKAKENWIEFHELLKPFRIRARRGAYNIFLQLEVANQSLKNTEKQLFPAKLITFSNWRPAHILPMISNFKLEGRSASFQTSVVTSISTFFPIFSDHYYCFGNISKNRHKIEYQDNEILKNLISNIEIPNPSFGVHSLGTINPDNIRINNFDSKTILLLDQSSYWADGHYGLGYKIHRLKGILTDLGDSLQKIGANLIIRPHPIGKNSWAEFKIEGVPIMISNSDIDISQSIRMASFTIGFFSKSLIESASFGIPPIFFNQDGGFTPGEFHDFNDLICNENELRIRIIQYLTDVDKYQIDSKKAALLADDYLTPSVNNAEEIVQNLELSR